MIFVSILCHYEIHCLFSCSITYHITMLAFPFHYNVSFFRLVFAAISSFMISSFFFLFLVNLFVSTFCSRVSHQKAPSIFSYALYHNSSAAKSFILQIYNTQISCRLKITFCANTLLAYAEKQSQKSQYSGDWNLVKCFCQKFQVVFLFLVYFSTMAKAGCNCSCEV